MGSYTGSSIFFDNRKGEVVRPEDANGWCYKHKSSYIYKATMNCIQGIMLKQKCEVEGEENG